MGAHLADGQHAAEVEVRVPGEQAALDLLQLVVEDGELLGAPLVHVLVQREAAAGGELLRGAPSGERGGVRVAGGA